jgi:hypothetical protein
MDSGDWGGYTECYARKQQVHAQDEELYPLVNLALWTGNGGRRNLDQLLARTTEWLHLICHYYMHTLLEQTGQFRTAQWCVLDIIWVESRALAHARAIVKEPT